MKISIVFPSVMYREGPEGVQKLIRGIENIGFHELSIFDHVVMGYPTDTRPAPFYSPKMPIVEAFTLLAYAAAITKRISLSTGVLVLPQRQPTLVAKQVSTLDTLSGGRMRLGVGVGWQASEYQALQTTFETRGAQIDEAIQLLRKYWQDEHVNFHGEHYQANEMAMEPKPPQGGKLPIWIGGTKAPALQRVAKHGDGWMAMRAPGDPPLEQQIQSLHELIKAQGREPNDVGMQMSLSPGALSREQRKRFYADPELMLDRVVELKGLGFTRTVIDCVPIFQQGYRSVDDLLGYLAQIHQRLATEIDQPPTTED